MNVVSRLPARLSQGLLPAWRGIAVLIAAVAHVALVGCATWRAPATFEDAALRARAVTDTAQGVRLSAAVLSSDDSRQLLGADVNGTGVQPVWIEVQNATQQTLWLLRAGTDPDYFSPLEVAWSFHAPLAGTNNAAIDEHFDGLGFQNPIPPWSTRKGLLFTNPDRLTKLLNVDLLGQGSFIPFTLFLPIPDDVQGDQALEILERRAEAPSIEYRGADTFRAALEKLPCCATGPAGTASGDPINVVLVGTLADIGAALGRRGFRRETKDLDNAQRLYGRPPDVVARKAGQGGVPANWLRLWIAPLRYQGKPVFVGQAGRPVGGRFAVAEEKDLVLHPEVDEARNLLIQDLLYSGGLAKLGFVNGVGAASVANPRDSVGETAYYTDGLRAVLFFVTRPRSLSEVEILDWVPYLERREAAAAAENRNRQR